MMNIQEFFSSDKKTYWLEKMKACDWGAGQWLAELLSQNRLQETVGNGVLVPMLIDGEELVSFCTFAPLDEIQPTKDSPWIGFLYTFPAYRGHRYAGMLLDWCECMATIMGKENIYISTDHIGLYEKYGYEFLNTQKTVNGEISRVYKKALSIASEEKEIRMKKGDKWKAEIPYSTITDWERT